MHMWIINLAKFFSPSGELAHLLMHACFRALIGDNIATMNQRDLKQLEGRLEKGLGKIRARKVQ
jgi:hypothetical protein